MTFSCGGSASRARRRWRAGQAQRQEKKTAGVQNEEQYWFDLTSSRNKYLSLRCNHTAAEPHKKPRSYLQFSGFVAAPLSRRTRSQTFIMILLKISELFINMNRNPHAHPRIPREKYTSSKYILVGFSHRSIFRATEHVVTSGAVLRTKFRLFLFGFTLCWLKPTWEQPEPAFGVQRYGQKKLSFCTSSEAPTYARTHF